MKDLAAFNIEIKARAHDFSRAKELAESITDTPPEVIEQEDTFFRSPTGRLKLRVFNQASGELIYYERADESGPKRSKYYISTTTDPASLNAVLTSAL